MRKRWLRAPVLLAATVLAAGCAVTRPPAQVEASLPAQFHAPLPHGGQLADMSRWWEQWQDPLLVQLIDAAQAASPTLAQAVTRIENARATRVAASASLLPALDATASASRGFTQPPIPLATTVQGGLQTAWEIDLFGANRATANAAQARLEGAHAGWHEARVSVAAEAANSYINLRTCERQLAVAQNDAKSRAETARLSELGARAGFTAPATAALARDRAAVAGAVKPASVLSWFRREVSARERASFSVTASKSWQVRSAT